MFDAIKRASEQLEDKTGIAEYYAKFRGFSGNDEPNHMGYAMYLVSCGYYPSLGLSEHAIDSHYSSMLCDYRPMLERWNESQAPLRLTKADIIRIVGDRPGTQAKG